QFAAAEQAGALATKVCGAGGGGCALALVEPNRRQAVGAALEAAGAELLSPGLQAMGVRQG
ncbi:mevalonate kinase, partial [bacterium]|nr:mevalonate kinase [bacterium]